MIKKSVELIKKDNKKNDKKVRGDQKEEQWFADQFHLKIKNLRVNKG